MRVMGDFHIHSTYSGDSVLSVRLIVSTLRRLGFEVAAITDHNTWEGGVRGYALSKAYPDLLIIPGIEYMTDKGEIIVLCEHPISLPYRLEEAVVKARDEGGVVIAVHPFDTWRRGIGRSLYSVKVDLIEVFNAGSPPRANEEAQVASRKLGIPGVACSDAHSEEYLGLAWNMLEVGSLDVDSVLEALRKGPIKWHAKYPGALRRVKSLSKRLLRRVARWYE